MGSGLYYCTDPGERRFAAVVTLLMGLMGFAIGIAGWLDGQFLLPLFLGCALLFFIAALIASYEKGVEIEPDDDLVRVTKGTFLHRGCWEGVISAMDEVGIVTGGRSRPSKTLYFVVLRGDPGVMIPGYHYQLDDALEVAREIADATDLSLNEKPTWALPLPLWK